jgi:flagellin-like hook-associated protein FlgL
MDRLSTGKRISSAKDDIGGFVMATTFEKDIRAAAQGAENTKHAIALLETVSSAANQAINILTRMKELSGASVNGRIYSRTTKLIWITNSRASSPSSHELILRPSGMGPHGWIPLTP